MTGTRPCSNCIRLPYAQVLFDEADVLAPGRRTTSDGTCGDEAHQADWTTDHNGYQPTCIEHAVDMSHDPGVYDAQDFAISIAAKWKAGHNFGLKYIVANFGGCDMIFYPAKNGYVWTQNGTCKTGHRNHVHYSFLDVVDTWGPEHPFHTAIVLPPNAPLPPTTNTPFPGDDDMVITEQSARLDANGNGYIDVKGVKAKDVFSVFPVGASDPQVTHKYPHTVKTELTIAASSKVARVIITGGTARQQVRIRIVHA